MNGIYEQIINKLFRNKLERYDNSTYYIGRKEIGREEAIRYLSQYLYNILQNLISETATTDEGVEKSILTINKIITKLGIEFNIENYENNLIDASNSILTSVIKKASCDYPDIENYLARITPITSLTKSSLFTGSNQSINMISELKKEILSSDEIHILVSFILQSGLNLMFNELKEFTEQGRKLKIITTTYMGITESSAIKRLAQLPNTEIKISYNKDNDRLHAKAYIFLRNSGFSTAYIGSSNISKAALTEGLEWNVKATQIELPHIINTVNNTFDSYWGNRFFETFNLATDTEKLKDALKERPSIDYSILDLIRAKEYQNEILDKLDIERIYHNHYKNLIVAATGTGKTVIAAFDYKRFKEKEKRANFLFVVHREEIIKQACATFRNVLNDQNFGEMWYGGHEANKYTHLFASKDLLNNRIEGLNLPDDYYDYIIFDEAHHIVAETYQKILKKFKPKILLGLTATPERMDSQDITKYFGNSISAEIRLDTALNNHLLAPFKYYGITDSVDLSEIRWVRGGFVSSELSKVYTNNDIRTGVIVNALEKYLPNYDDVRALCFCVDKRHAEYMNAKFTLCGLKSAVLTSDNSQFRNYCINQLAEKKINYLFVVDMFNEGIDIPNIDTVMFLRPTESLTIFLQQFGRGLRKAKGKTHLTVLDFVGKSRMEFDYMDRFRALIGRSSMSVKEEIELDFPHLPSGCSIQLEEKAKDYILDNINSYIKRFQKNRIIQTIKTFDKTYNVPLSLRNFINVTQIPIEKIYKGATWNDLCRQAGSIDKNAIYNDELHRAVYRKWLSTDSYSYFSFIKSLVDKSFHVKEAELSDIEKKMSLMLYYDLFDKAGQFNSLQEMLEILSTDNIFINEVKELMPILLKRCNNLEHPDNSAIHNYFPLKLHGEYTKAQIQVAIGTSTINRKSSAIEGCERNIINGHPIEAMYVDIIKDREVGSNTNYNDYAITSNKFHWESQNRVSPETKTGQNYIKQAQTMLLFVRKQATAADDKSRTMGYIYLGEVLLESYKGSKPMQIVWKLKTPMPGHVFEYAAKCL